jgi:hypothetical protein
LWRARQPTVAAPPPTVLPAMAAAPVDVATAWWPTPLTSYSAWETWLTADIALIEDPYYDLVDMTPSIQAGVFNVTLAEPGLAWLYPFAWENDFEGAGHHSMWFRKHMHLAFVIVVVYLVVVFGLRRAMRSRQRVPGVRLAWISWNFLLSAFSWWGALRMVPHLALLVRDRGWFVSYCGNSVHTYGAGEASGLATVLFVASKVRARITRLRVVSLVHVCVCVCVCVCVGVHVRVRACVCVCERE